MTSTIQNHRLSKNLGVSRFTPSERAMWVAFAQESHVSIAAARAGVHPGTIRKWARSLKVSLAKPTLQESLPAPVAAWVSSPATEHDDDAFSGVDEADLFEYVGCAADGVYDSGRYSARWGGSLFEHGRYAAAQNNAKLLRPQRVADLVEGGYTFYFPETSEEDDLFPQWVDEEGRKELLEGVLSEYPAATEEALLICEKALSTAREMADRATANSLNAADNGAIHHVDYEDEDWFRERLADVIRRHTGNVLYWEEAEDIVRHSLKRIPLRQR